MNTSWDSVAVAAREAFRSGIIAWIGQAKIGNTRIHGPNAELPPGFLASSYAIEPHILAAMVQAGVPNQIAKAFSSELASAWKEWSDGFQMVLPGAFPAFAAFPGPQAPPTPAAQGGYLLAMGSSPGEHRLRANNLEQRLLSALKTAIRGSVGSEKAIRELALWVDSSFHEWKERAQVIGVMGKGPVPSFAPPYVPVGPVIAGDNIGIPGQIATCLAGPRFGKVVIGR